ncbi:MAG TPA: O-antigen ligase family protein [Polyangiaceae bacterium]|nr:O-antigen ligase family protein [Polyangiaceae bacterium]
MPSETRIGGDVWGAVGVAVLLSCVAALLEDTWVGIGLCLIIVPALLYAAARVPLRYSLMVMMFFALVLPNPNEGIPTFDWLPPGYALGRVLLNHLNTFDHDNALLRMIPVSAMEIAFIILAIIYFARKANGSRIDTLGRLATPEPMLKLTRWSLLAILFVWLWGLVRGGSFGHSLWQLNAVVYIPICFLLFQAAIRGPQDHAALAKTLLAAAAYKSLLATYVMQTVRGDPDPWTKIPAKLPYATAHADSVLFADACLVMIALLLERAKIKRWAAFLLPLFMLGMIMNNRRLVWVQLIAVLATVFIVSKDNPIKRLIKRATLVGIPVAALYVAAGWNSGGGRLFKPVRTLRSVIDAKSDGSSYWRELENFNLIATLRQNPIFGSGFGHPYPEYVPMPPVDYPLEHYVPHNGILGLWAFCGVVGWAGLTMLWAGGVYFAMRAYHGAQRGTDRAAALVCFGAVLVWLMQAWGDLGLGVWTSVFTVAPAFAVASKLAVATGEWQEKRKTEARPAAVGPPA